MSPVLGLHHVSALVGDPQTNVDFYGGLLGLRLVKQTVNFDDPKTYHLYYADGDAQPGAVLTFFPWPDAVPGRIGEGQAVATAYAVPEGALDFWMDRLAAEAFPFGNPALRFGQRVLPLTDPHGLALELIETTGTSEGWNTGPLPPDVALGAFHSVTLCVAHPAPLVRLLTDVMGYREVGEEDGRLRLVNDSAERAAFLDVACPAAGGQGRLGTGVVHHVAFRVPDDEQQRAVRDTLHDLGFQPTPVRNRKYFHSVYFRAPGGPLFEIATDGPGFAVDEPADRLGQALQLPLQHERLRDYLEATLPPLRLPVFGGEEG